MKTKTFTLAILALATIVLSAAPVSAAEVSRHSIYTADRETIKAPASKFLLAQDTLRSPGGDAYAVAEFYAINEPLPEPKPAAEVSDKKAWYWVGGAGAALVAGLTAWLVLRDDSESSPSHVIAAIP